MKHLFVALLSLVLAGPGLAHEFWIEPDDYTIAPDAPLVAQIKVGEMFGGSGYSYNPRNFRRFDVVTATGTEAVPGRPGDRPALNIPAPEPGLAVIVHETTDTSLTYSQAGKFENFLRHKDWIGLLDLHIARGLPETGFRERYSRYGKSLVAVGDGAGADSQVGLLTEIVALANPYTETLTEMPVQVFYDSAVRADVQVEVFEKAPGGGVVVEMFRTDQEGIARVPVRSGYSYLFDAVVIREVEPVEERDPVWESLWASLTFAVP